MALGMRMPFSKPIDGTFGLTPSAQSNSLVSGGRSFEREHRTPVPSHWQGGLAYLEMGTAPQAK